MFLFRWHGDSSDSCRYQFQFYFNSRRCGHVIYFLVHVMLDNLFGLEKILWVISNGVLIVRNLNVCSGFNRLGWDVCTLSILE